MSSLSELAPLSPKDRAEFGVARAKSIAFDAVHALWRKRKAQGKSQAELAKVLGKDEGWLSKTLRGPSNWTIRTLGELVEILDGDLEITIRAAEDVVDSKSNYNVYSEYENTIRLPPLIPEKPIHHRDQSTLGVSNGTVFQAANT